MEASVLAAPWQLTVAAFVTGVAVGFAAHALAQRAVPEKPRAAPPAAAAAAPTAAEDDSDEDSSVVPPRVELKMVIAVRNDLGMSKGKIAAQVAHAVLGAYRAAQRGPALSREWLKAWYFRAAAKITLRVEDEATLLAVATAASDASLPVSLIEDAGRTEVEPGTRTCVAIGPAPKDVIDAITGPRGRLPLKLLA